MRTGLNEDTNDDIKQENVTIHNKIGEVCVKLQEIRQVTGARSDYKSTEAGFALQSVVCVQVLG